MEDRSEDRGDSSADLMADSFSHPRSRNDRPRSALNTLWLTETHTNSHTHTHASHSSQSASGSLTGTHPGHISKSKGENVYFAERKYFYRAFVELLLCDFFCAILWSLWWHFFPFKWYNFIYKYDFSHL